MLVFVGGGLGASARYWLSAAVYKLMPPDFPYGNLAVNILGCLLIGILMSSLDDRFLIQPALRTFLTVGILGGFTTFSSFSYETVALLRDNQTALATINVFATIMGCLLATYVGIFLGRLL